MECFILASQPIATELCSNIKPTDFVIAVDKGWLQAEKLGIKVDLIVGDFDSAPMPEYTQNVVKLPQEKDETDTYYAAMLAIQKGAKKVTILGGLGGRVDHTFANIQTLQLLAEKNIKNSLVDEHNKISCFLPQKITLPAEENKYLSLFSVTPKVKGITIKGTKYTLNNAEIANIFPIGISNEIVEKQAELSWNEGILLVMVCEK